MSDILAECLKNTGLWYRLEDDVIIISPKLVSPQKVGEKLGISRSYVSRIEKRALEKLKKALDNSYRM